VKAGPMMASAASWDIHIQGYGSHGARPESSVDPILMVLRLSQTFKRLFREMFDRSKQLLFQFASFIQATLITSFLKLQDWQVLPEHFLARS